MSSPLDDHIRSVLDRVRATLSGQLESELIASTADIARAAADEQRHAVIDAAERAAAEMRQEAEQQLAVVQGEFDRQREELQRAASERAVLERTLDDMREELATARQNLNDAQREREALVEQLEAIRRDEELARHEFQDAIDRARCETEQTRVESDATVHELEVVRADLARTARLASALRTLDEATSLGDILERLAQSVCQETDRTAVFLVNGERRLRGWRAVGFEAPIVGSDLDTGDAGVVGEALRSGVGQSHRSGDDALLPAFASNDGPRDAIALPVQVGGSVVAVLYADAARADKPEKPEWLDTIDTMAMHAGRVLEAMTMRQAAALWTPRPGARSTPAGRGDGSSVGVG